MCKHTCTFETIASSRTRVASYSFWWLHRFGRSPFTFIRPTRSIQSTNATRLIPFDRIPDVCVPFRLYVPPPLLSVPFVGCSHLPSIVCLVLLRGWVDRRKRTAKDGKGHTHTTRRHNNKSNNNTTRKHKHKKTGGKLEDEHRIVCCARWTVNGNHLDRDNRSKYDSREEKVGYPELICLVINLGLMPVLAALSFLCNVR